MTCTASKRIKTVQIDETTFVVAHIPKVGASVECEGFSKKLITHDFDRGAFRFIIAPNCVIKVHGKVNWIDLLIFLTSIMHE